MTLKELHSVLKGQACAGSLLRAATAMGNGSIEEKLIRLMVYVGAVLKSGPEHTKEDDPIKILRSGSAWCDQQVMVFLWLVWKLLDLPGRDIAVYHTDGKNGHTVCEVYYQGGWHLFDIHTEHQAVYRRYDGKIMSLVDICNCPEVVEAEGHWWVGENGEGKVGFYQGERKPPMICGIRFE